MAVDLTTSGTGAVSASDPFTALLSNSGGLASLINAAFGTRQQQSSNTNTISTSQTGKTSPLALDMLSQYLPSLFGSATSGDFSKQAAISDAQGGVNLILKNLKESTLPGVFRAESATGGYNTTTKNLLTNNLATQAAAQAQGLVTDTVSKYASAESQRQQNLINALNTAVNAQQLTTQNSVSNAATVGDTTNKGQLQNPLVQGAAGLAALTSLANSLGITPAALAKILGISSQDWSSLGGDLSSAGGLGTGSTPIFNAGGTSPDYPNAGVPGDLLGGDELPIYGPE